MLSVGADKNMFNKFKAVTLAAVTVASTIVAGQALSFDGSAGFVSQTVAVGTCSARVYTQYTAVSAQGAAYVSLNSAYPAGDILGGTSSSGWSGMRSNYGTAAAFSQATIEGCGISSVDQLSIVGLNKSISYTSLYPTEAVGADIWEIQDYYGFSFIGTDDASGVRSRYEFAVKGRSQTLALASVIPVNAPPPTAIFSGGPSTVYRTTPFDVNVTFSRDVIGFDPLTEAGDITIANASITAISGSGSTYTLTVTPSGNGDISISIPAGAAQDFASTSNTMSGVETVIYDPNVVLAEVSGAPNFANASPFNVTISFDSVVSGFDPINDPSDMNIVNANVTAIAGGPSSYILTLTPTGAGTISISVPAGAAHNSLGNPNVTSNLTQVTYNATSPSVNITGAPAALDGTNPFDVTVNFSEPVYSWSFTDFSIAATNAAATITGTGAASPGGNYSEYIVTITPSRHRGCYNLCSSRWGI